MTASHDSYESLARAAVAARNTGRATPRRSARSSSDAIPLLERITTALDADLIVAIA